MCVYVCLCVCLQGVPKKRRLMKPIDTHLRGLPGLHRIDMSFCTGDEVRVVGTLQAGFC